MDNKEFIVKSFILKVGNVYGAMGLAGNVWCESGFKSNALENIFNKRLGMTDEEYTDDINIIKYSREQFIRDNAGYGLCQWTYKSRKEQLYDFAISYCFQHKIKFDISNVDMQLDFIIKELTTSHKSVYQVLLGAYDKVLDINERILLCSNFVLMNYERPAGYTTQKVQAERYQIALNLFDAVMKRQMDGWVSYGDEWFYLQDGCTLCDKWLLDKDKWYHFNANGLMEKNKFLMYNGDTYYVDIDGTMVSARKMIIDNKEYEFDATGKLI